jgi:hypothetical protein
VLDTSLCKQVRKLDLAAINYIEHKKKRQPWSAFSLKQNLDKNPGLVVA